MSEIVDAAKQFSIKLKNCREFTEYAESRAALLADEEIGSFYLLYKKAKDELGAREMSYDEEKRISSLYWDLMFNEKARRYFEAEKRLVAVLKEIFGLIDNVMTGIEL